MGPLESILGMITRHEQGKNMQVDEREFVKDRGDISSMTKKGTCDHNVLNGKQEERIALGVEDRCRKSTGSSNNMSSSKKCSNV